MPETRIRDWRTTSLGVASLIAAVVALIQRTSMAPFPHAADDFLGGFAIGAGIATFFVWLSSRS